jgi:hypothetical protein
MNIEQLLRFKTFLKLVMVTNQLTDVYMPLKKVSNAYKKKLFKTIFYY